MTANGYVRCGGCGGFLPAGAICGYCLQQQAAMPAPQPKAVAKPARPLRTGLILGLCAFVVCGIGAASVYAIKNVGKAAQGANPLAGLTTPAGGSATLNSQSSQDMVAALSSGNPQQALAAMESIGSEVPSTMQSTAPETQPLPVTQAGGSSPVPTMEAAKAGMPDDVRRWLEHLQKIEQARITLAATQLQDGVKTLTGLQAGDIMHSLDEESNDTKEAEERKQNERAQRVGGDMQNMEQAWRTLLRAFDSVPAPAECVGIKASYDQVIGQTGSMMMDIVRQIRSASKDPQAAVSALTAMQGTSKGKIDVPARAADQGVGSVCRRYDVVKWFDIQGDVGGGVMSQLGF